MWVVVVAAAAADADADADTNADADALITFLSEGSIRSISNAVSYCYFVYVSQGANLPAIAVAATATGDQADRRRVFNTSPGNSTATTTTTK